MSANLDMTLNTIKAAETATREAMKQKNLNAHERLLLRGALHCIEDSHTAANERKESGTVLQ